MNKKRELTNNELIECSKLKTIFTNKKGGLNLTQDLIAENLGITQSAVNHYLNGKNALNAKIASGFAKLLQIKVQDFSQRLADELETLVTERCNISEVAPHLKLKEVPIIQWQDLNSWDGIKKFTNNKERIFTMKAVSENTYALKVSNDAMSPEFIEGDIIIVDPEKTPIDGSYVVVKLKGELPVFKQYVIDGDRSFLRSTNMLYAQQMMREFSKSDKLCGVVVGKYKEY